MNGTILVKNSSDLFSAACWRRLRTVRKGALRSGTATDNPDRRCFWLQHSFSLSLRRKSCGTHWVCSVTWFLKLNFFPHRFLFYFAPDSFQRLWTSLCWDGLFLSETEFVNGISVSSASPEDSWTVSQRASGGWMDTMSPQQQQDSLSRGGGQQENKRVCLTCECVWYISQLFSMSRKKRWHVN